MSDTEEFSDSFIGTSPLPPGVEPKKLAVIRYKGKLEKPQWIDVEPGQCGISMVTLRCLTRSFGQKTMRPCAMWWWMRQKSLALVSFLQLGSRASPKPMRLCTPMGRLCSRPNYAGRKGYAVNFVLFDRTTLLMISPHRTKRNGAPPFDPQ